MNSSESLSPGSVDQRTVALMANFRTRNLGNLALTSITQQLMVERYGQGQVRAVHRAPHALVDLVTDAPVDEWQARLARRLGPLHEDGSVPDPPALRDPGLSPKGAERRVPPWWKRPLVAAAHSRAGLEVRARRSDDQARRHYQDLLSATDVVWVPGGEISTLTHPRNRLLDVVAAKASGLRVAMANFSFEPSAATEEVFRELAPRLDRVVTRDEVSAERLVGLGLPDDRVSIVPDAVFLLGSGLVPSLEAPAPGPRRDVVGIVLHGLTPLPRAEWGRLVAGIRDLGLGVEVLSSHLEFDHEVIATLLDVAGGDIEVRPEFTSVDAYVAHLKTLRGLVTARFHSAVMGIVTGAVVAGVDSYGRKVAGALATAGLDDLSAAGQDWPERAIEIVSNGTVAGDDRLAECRSRIWAGYGAALPMEEGR